MTPCMKDPTAWDTYREKGGQRRKATLDELEYAINQCRVRCPQFAACLARPAPMDMVQAGTVYSGGAIPTIGAFLNEPKTSDACGTEKGTRTGWHLHREAEEPQCPECAQAEKTRQDRCRKPVTECRNGHTYTDATVRVNNGGQRMCLICRPECRPKVVEPRPVQMACARSGHDWNDPRNLGLQADGHRYCQECKRIDRRARDARRRARRAAGTTSGEVAA